VINLLVEVLLFTPRRESQQRAREGRRGEDVDLFAQGGGTVRSCFMTKKEERFADGGEEGFTTALQCFRAGNEDRPNLIPSLLWEKRKKSSGLSPS